MMKKVLNDLFDYKGMKIYQYDNGFKFSLDSILLAEFVSLRKKDTKILDLCTGNAVVPLILSTKYPCVISGVEIQNEIFQLGKESVDLNKKQEQIHLINDNIMNINKYFKNNSIDVITCNPPYFKQNKKAVINNSISKALARHEICATLEDIVSVVSKLLKNDGQFYLVHRTERLEEIITLLNKYNLHIKKIQFVYYNTAKDSHLVLFKIIKNANMGLKINSPLFIDELESFQNIFDIKE